MLQNIWNIHLETKADSKQRQGRGKTEVITTALPGLQIWAFRNWARYVKEN